MKRNITRRDAMQRMAVAGAGTFFARCGSRKTVKRPNIIFVMTDDQTVDQMSCYGNPILQLFGLIRTVSFLKLI